MSVSPRKACTTLLVALFLALTSLAPSALAQTVYGSIFGTVTDATGAGVPNAKVTIINVAQNTSVDVTTNESGNYTRGQLLAGTYRVEVTGSGFSKTVLNNITVNVDASARADFTLQVGDVTQSVEVTSGADLLKQDRAEVSTILTSKELVELPSLNRNFQAFELLAPGTNRLGWQHASSENPQGSVQIQVNGQHFSGTDWLLDGTSNQDPILGIIVINPTIDSVTETKIASQNFDAEFGLAAAGVQLITTKSGTNQLHGTLFEYLRNNSPGFQSFARNPFNSAEDQTVPPVKWNNFGGVIGGKIIKDKLFFFGDTQLTRRRTGSTVKTTVPTLRARNGDLGEYLQFTPNNQIYDPLSGNTATGVGRVPFANNVIPQGRLNPQAQNLIKLFPAPNAPGDPGSFGTVNNYVASGSENFDSEQWNTRIDYFINAKSAAFGRYSYAAYRKTAPPAFGPAAGGRALDGINFAGTSDTLNQSVAGGYTYNFSPTLITDFRFGYMRYRVVVTPGDIGTSPATTAGIPGLNFDNFYTSGLPQINIGDGTTYLGYGLGANQCNCPLAEREQQYQFVDNTTKVLGNHNLKFGVDLRFALNLRVPSDNHRSGELNFLGNYTGQVSQAGANSQNGNPFATFLLGQVTSFRRYVSSATDASERQKRIFLYTQDTFRATPKLTLSYGLRWEMIFPETVNKAGNGGQLDLRTGLINVFGVGQVSDHGIQEMNWRNFAPRLGVTYQLTKNTVVRAGYGWSYALGTFGSLFGHNVTQNLPVLAIQNNNQPSSFQSVFSLAQGPQAPTFPVADANGRFPLPDGVAGKARPLDVRLPRSMAYNLTVQHQFKQNVSIEAAYVGNVGRHVFAGDGPDVNVNPPAFIPGLSNQNLARPFYSKYGWTQDISLYCNCATNRYDSFQATLNMRSLTGISGKVNYTYQVSQGDSGDAYTFNYNRPLGYGNKDFISHHQIAAPVTYDIPFGKGRKYGNNLNRGIDYALGGWTVTGVTLYYSGRPFTPNIGTAPSGAVRPYTGPGGRPDVGTADPYSGARGGREQFYVGGLGGAFLLPANNTFGNYGINTLYGPLYIQQDFTLAKNFALTERVRFQIRAEAFNAFNHSNLGQPEGNVTSPNAGLITGLADNSSMRRLQFGARIDF